MPTGWSNMIESLLIVWAYLILQMLVVWVFSRLLNNPSIVDVAWAFGLMVAGLIYLCRVQLDFRIMLIGGLLILWGVRLGGFLWVTRIRKGIVDKRYLKLSENWQTAKALKFFLNFQFQGFLILLISSVFLFATNDATSNPSNIEWLGVAIVLVGIMGETIADLQLYRFQHTNPGEVCQAGSWNYSRHPNYFFEWLTWCGFTLFALHQPFGTLPLVVPLVLYLIMTHITGPLTERGSIESRGQAYKEYQRSTAMFFPFFKK
jgi:steroid 5-alpha reductase family enzyme